MIGHSEFTRDSAVGYSATATETLHRPDGIQRQVLEATQALYYALEAAADMLRKCASGCRDCDGSGARLDGGVCEECAPIRDAERHARDSQSAVPQIEQLGQQAEESRRHSVAAVSNQNGRLRAERDLALKVCLAIREHYYPSEPAGVGSGRIYNMASSAIYEIERGLVEGPPESPARGQQRSQGSDGPDEGGSVLQTNALNRSWLGRDASGNRARTGNDASRAAPGEGVVVTVQNLSGAIAEEAIDQQLQLAGPPLMEALSRLNLEIIHYRSRGRGIQFLINGLLEALDQARGTAARQALGEVSRAEMIDRLRNCRDSFMRPGAEPIYSPAEMAIAIDAAIGRLPAEVSSLPRAVDLVRELESAVNEFEAFGLKTEAEAHRRFLHGIRDDGYLPGPTGMSVTDSSGSTLFASEDVFHGDAEGVLDSETSP